MANDETNKNSFESICYSMTFGNTITAPSDNLEQLTLKQGVDVKLIEDKKVYLLTLQNVKVIKKIYQPVEIEADLDFMEQTSIYSDVAENKAPSFMAVSTLLLQRQVVLKVFSDNLVNGFTVAENCYVYELKPQLKVDVKGTRMNVKLSIFSMDKLMTLNKYSKAYVASRLGSEILRFESSQFGTKADDQSPLIETNSENMIHLIYSDVSSDNKTLERIQPYLVQYNESFYDFLVRTSNRCGEFLYFEDGKLTLGLPMTKWETDPNTKNLVQKAPFAIQDYESVVMKEVASDPMVIKDYVRDSMKDGSEVGDLNFSVIEKLDNGFPKDAFTDELSGNAELSNDEYNFPLIKDKFSSLKREALYDKPINKVINSLKAITMGDDLTASVVGLGVSEGLLAMGSNTQAGNTNKALQQNNIAPYTKKKEQSKDGKVVQFATLNEAGWINNKFYNDIRQYETEQERQVICIKMGQAFVPVKLGQRIKVEGLVDNYIIIEIQISSEDYANGKAGRRQQTICAIPTLVEGTNEKYYPPVQPVPVIRKSGPQTAFVTDNNDPKYQGRVRVAFPWQSLKKGLKNQLEKSSQSLKQTKDLKQKLKEEKRQMKLRLWNVLESMNALIVYAKASPAVRVHLLADKNAEITALTNEITKLEQDKTALEYTVITPLDGQSEPDPRVEANKLSIKELESKIKIKKEKLAAKQEELKDMEAAAEEHDQKKNSKGYVVEKNNSVVKARRDKCESLYKDEYVASNEKIKKLKEEEKTLESKKEKAQKLLEKDILENSTPWIRVAQPMATPGGGTYFKPRVGDEVLINFDNDNVERPYVVGSLYSKNNLDPFESFERRGAPGIQFGTGKQVSMSIMSPNGHHITFSDPKDGNKFVYGLNPGTKFWGPMFPIPSLPNSKELAGGIHIGDRYGIYEIEMCTHDRAISIKSPLGTVDISAFTGITITAPNGDVNIRGKNVNIAAGNKVTITSGNNIKPAGIGEPDYRCGTPVWHSLKKARWWAPLTFFANLGRGIRYGALFLGHQIMAAAPAIVNDTLGPAAFADLSLIRHMFEVAVKPVDGTMLIKSKRYLKLEAGTGETKIKADRFNDDRQIDSLERFYIRLIEGINTLNAEIDQFFDNYKNLKESAYKSKGFYDAAAKAFLKNEKDPDIKKISLKATSGPWKKSIIEDIDFTDKMKDEDVEFKGSTYRGDKKVIKFKSLATPFSRYVHELYKHAAEVQALFEGYPDDEVFRKAAKDAYNKVIDPYYKEWKNRFWDTDDSTDQLLSEFEDSFMKEVTRTLIKRKVTALYLINVKNSEENKGGKFLYLGYDESDVVDDKVKSDYNWKNFMTHFDHGSTHGNKALIYLLDGLWEPIKKRFKNPIGVLKENEIWGDKGGQILFSDNDGATMHIEGEGLKSETQSNLGNRDQLLKLLLSIK